MNPESVRTHHRSLRLALSCAVLLLWAAGLAAQPVQSPPNQPNTASPGGSYKGPGDIIPPNGGLPPFDPNVDCTTFDPATCDACDIEPTSCGPACSKLGFTRDPEDECVYCRDDPDGEACFRAKSFSLTFGDLRGYCDDPDDGVDRCSDAAGNFTVRLTVPNACEVWVLSSAWVNHDFFPNRPLCSPVAGQICVDGDPKLMPPHAFDTYYEGGLQCEAVTVSLTLDRDCVCAAVRAWEGALGLQPGQPSFLWDGKWWFNVGVVKCQDCDCPGG